MSHIPKDVWMRENARRREARQRRILDALGAGGFVRGIDLARMLSVSKRTVYRDVEEMKDVGEPIGGAAGLGYALTRRRHPARQAVGRDAFHIPSHGEAS